MSNEKLKVNEIKHDKFKKWYVSACYYEGIDPMCHIHATYEEAIKYRIYDTQKRIFEIEIPYTIEKETQ